MRLNKKDFDATIKFQQQNPKTLGSAAYRRYSDYCRATTIREALYWGATPEDIRHDETKGFLIRSSKHRIKKQSKNGERIKKGRVMAGIVLDGNKYIAERYFYGLGIQARKKASIEDAQISLKAIDKVVAGVQSRINKKIMAGKRLALEDFVVYVKAAVAEEQEASPNLGVEKWRYYSKTKICNAGFTAACLQKLRKDPQFSFGLVEFRVLQDTMENTLRGWLKLVKAAGLTELSDLQGIDGVITGRRAADMFAREELAGLKKGEFTSDAVILKALRLWGFDKCASRQNVLPDGYDWVHSDTLGIIEDRQTHNLIVSAACQGHESFIRLLCSWARRRSPDGDLPFTTIALNKNYAGRLHRDAGNIGPSIGISIGNFTGGKLRYWAGDSNKGARSTSVEKVRVEPSVALNLKEGAVFDGNCAHEVEPYKGERYSLIFFTVKKYKKTGAHAKRKMVSMGADWPTDASLKRLQSKVPRLAAQP